MYELYLCDGSIVTAKGFISNLIPFVLDELLVSVDDVNSAVVVIVYHVAWRQQTNWFLGRTLYDMS